MRVLLCERSFNGHRQKYVEWISHIVGIEFFVYAPENVGLSDEYYFRFDESLNTRSVKDYIRWIANIARIVKEKQIDIVHFLDGDSIMRYFGLGFNKFGKAKILVTYHHYFSGKLRKLSYKRMLASKSSSVVIHTNSIEQQFNKNGITCTNVCEYPAFDFNCIEEYDILEAKKIWGVSPTIPTIGIVGGINTYKNIIPFLNALLTCEKEFFLLICGAMGDITKEEFDKAIQGFLGKSVVKAVTLTEHEYYTAIVASDILFCIYGKSFDGASGPLTDGVCTKKMILSCEHGSLGQIVKENHLGITADCDNLDDMRNKTEQAIDMVTSFRYDEVAEAYRVNLKPERFIATYKAIYESAICK